MLNASPTEIDFDVYHQPRKPKASAYYRCVEDHFEQLETVWLPARRALRLGERHSGFNVYCGNAIWPHNQVRGGEKLARYIIRASFSQERMTYVAAKDSSDRVAKVIYQSKDAKTTKTFDALDWLAQLVPHIPNKGEQMVRYYGFYSNKSRGLRKKAGTDDQVPALML